MSSSRSLRYLTRLSCKACFGTARISTLGSLPPSFSPVVPAVISAVIYPCRYISTIPPLPADQSQHETQKTSSMSAGLVGQSGRHYQIERVLQEKGSAAGRVYLATYIAPEAQNANNSVILLTSEN